MRNWPENKINILLVRHGKTKWNDEKRYLGVTDMELSEAGKLQLKNCGKKFEGFKQAKIISGPMKRCVETARILFDKEPVIYRDMTEIDFGRFEGHNYMELRDDPYYQKWIDSNGELPFPEGESREDFIERSWKSFKNIIMDNLNEEKIVIVLHGGNIMAIMSIIESGLYFDYQIKNGEGLEISVDEAWLRKWNII